MLKRRPWIYLTWRERRARTAWTRSKSHLSEWFVVKTKPNQERYAAKNIRRQGHACLCPFIVEEGSTREKPLFAGHVFVQGPEWYYLKSTYGVVFPIMMGSEPARMPRTVMRDILRRCKEDDVITIKAERFTPGQTVMFKRGAWQGWTGVFKEAKAQNRVRILLRILGGEHEMEFDKGDITGELPPQPATEGVHAGTGYAVVADHDTDGDTGPSVDSGGGAPAEGGQAGDQNSPTD